jgi:Na+-driven multidrug efflux pump
MSFTGGIVTTELVGNFHSVDDVIGVQRIIIVSVVLSVVVGLLGTGVLLALGPQLMSAIGTHANMMDDTLLYLRIRAAAVPAALLLLGEFEAELEQE